MRCRECAAEVAVTARVCPRCGAPIVGQPPVVADAVVTDTAVGAVSDTAVSDAAGKAVPAGVAEQAPPEPYVPGSGDRVPAELRLVLAGYVGIAVWFVRWRLGLRRGCSSFSFSLSTTSTWATIVRPASLAVMAFAGAFGVVWAGLRRALEALKARIRFSRLLRRPSDPRTATVTASKRGGRTLILDIPQDAPAAVPAPVRGPPRVVDEGRHADAR